MTKTLSQQRQPRNKDQMLEVICEGHRCSEEGELLSLPAVWGLRPYQGVQPMASDHIGPGWP